MKIGVDCDGVLTDLSAYIFDRGTRYFGYREKDTSVYDVKDIFQCSSKEEFRFWLRYFFPYCRGCPPRDRATEIMGRLRGEGHQLYGITARMFVTRKDLLGWYSRSVLFRWLRKQGFRLQDIHLCDEAQAPIDKLAGCHRFAVDLMIEDKADVALYLAENGVRVLLFDTLYNQGLEHRNIIRVHDWTEIEKTVVGLSAVVESSLR